MRIGILGSGLMGGRLGTLFTRAGHDVVFSYSRDEARLKRLARRAGARARAGMPADAVRDADAVLLAVHWSRVDHVLELAGSLANRVLISCTLPMNTANTALVVGRTTSGAETLARKSRRARVVSAFSTAPSEVLARVFEGRRRARRPSLLFCGDDAGAGEIAAALIHDIGFDPVDVGPLRMARTLEPFSLLVAQLAYETDAGPEIAYRIGSVQRVRR